jgi:hypothetical protein
MAQRNLLSLLNNTSAAVAPTVALSLFGLIAAGGLAFDYARMASLDTELQNAADQAALAAASQLDGQTNACDRAIAAARALVVNQTRFSNDGSGRNILVAAKTGCGSGGSVRFYQDKAKATPANDPATARFVEVSVTSRQAVYALTPIVGLLNSGSLSGVAFASLGSSVCKVPPVMICNPQEIGGNTNVDIGVLVGKGLKLVSVGPGGGWAPGNFGYLNTGGGSNGAPGLREALGWVNPPGDCVSQSGVDTKPGATVSVTDALNTRFDIYDSNVACPSGGDCPSSINVVKDVVRDGNANGGNACRLHNQGWGEATPSSRRYLPTSATADYTPSPAMEAMGHPRDKCHAVASGTTGECAGPIGNGAWDRNAYFLVNYGWDASQWPTNTNTATNPLPSSPKRYDVYKWEIDHRGETIGGRVVLGPRITSGSGANAPRSYGLPVCSVPEGHGSGIVPGPTSVDRRRVSVAVINCAANSVNGNSTNVPVAKWMEVFLVEPSIARDRTAAGDVYVEVIGETTAGGSGATNGQVIRRDSPYLIE